MAVVFEGASSVWASRAREKGASRKLDVEPGSLDVNHEEMCGREGFFASRTMPLRVWSAMRCQNDRPMSVRPRRWAKPSLRKADFMHFVGCDPPHILAHFFFGHVKTHRIHVALVVDIQFSRPRTATMTKINIGTHRNSERSCLVAHMMLTEWDRPGLIEAQVSQSALRRSLERSTNHHERASKQGTERKAQCTIETLLMLQYNEIGHLIGNVEFAGPQHPHPKRR